MDTCSTKRDLRSRMRAVRDAIPPAERVEKSRTICDLVARDPDFANAQVIALYAAIGSEVDLLGLASRTSDAQRVALPVALPDHRMEFVAVSRNTLADLPDLLRKPGRIQERLPEGTEPLDVGDIDLMLVPGLAFDQAFYRLGYGGGYYDAFLARPGFRALTWGVCFAEQVVEALPREPHDRPLHRVITPRGPIPRNARA